MCCWVTSALQKQVFEKDNLKIINVHIGGEMLLNDEVLGIVRKDSYGGHCVLGTRHWALG